VRPVSSVYPTAAGRGSTSRRQARWRAPGRRRRFPAVLPAAGLYKPIQDYDRETLAKDLTAHLVYGTTAAAALQLLSPLTKHPRNG
jgi:hypothetical protein